ncbi:GGDEF domain-containing protein [Marispirochaeta sp.]|jgi:diguanylate cyclase (GGDEF)-like protein|uniref:GGDEF domain-containing protein n=1 Tax=Marispirochaeta sp. TaxID=2038653 RepID=UPI0029C68C3F|nr:GGDEF domain-containing protein [Marispirochaeta sp.]
MKDRNFLHSVDIFSSLLDEELDILISLLNTLSFKKEELLFSEGDDGEELFIVRSGTMGISVVLADGEELEVAEFGPREFFGEMSIFEGETRSATCRAKEKGTLLSLKAGDFFRMADRYPETANRIMHRMLNITARRLRKTNLFLNEMVSWGESARKRAITDDLTGLYNRGFFDINLKRKISEALAAGEPLCLAMADLDGFGMLNAIHGETVCNQVIQRAVEVFYQSFDERDILTRYGGDEFAFILPGRNLREAKELCDDICRRMRSMTVEVQSKAPIRISTSIGIAAVSDDAPFGDDLVKLADEALYKAKEAGRGRAVTYSGR